MACLAFTALAFACSSPSRDFRTNGASGGDSGGPGSAGSTSHAGGEPGNGDAGGLPGSPAAGGVGIAGDASGSGPLQEGGAVGAGGDGQGEPTPGECANDPCQNNGNCEEEVDGYTCSCTSRYTGPRCEYLEVKLVPATLGNGTSRATALSNDGKVLLFHDSISTSANMGRLIDFDSSQLIEPPSPLAEGGIIVGNSIDDDGSTIVGRALSSENDAYRAFKYVGNSATMLDLTQVPYAGEYEEACDVSADGSTAVGWVQKGSFDKAAFYCRGAQPCRQIPLDYTGVSRAQAFAVSGDGSVIVGSAAPSDLAEAGKAWRWDTSTTQGTFLSVDGDVAETPLATGVSRDGLVVVGVTVINGALHAVRWSGPSFTATDLGPGWAKGTSADGSVTVGIDNSNVPVVWFGTAPRTLESILGDNPDLAGAMLSDLVAVSDDGKVVAGTAYVAGVYRAFMARLP